MVKYAPNPHKDTDEYQEDTQVLLHSIKKDISKTNLCVRYVQSEQLKVKHFG